jgi:hypothetical protein
MTDKWEGETVYICRHSPDTFYLTGGESCNCYNDGICGTPGIGKPCDARAYRLEPAGGIGIAELREKIREMISNTNEIKKGLRTSDTDCWLNGLLEAYQEILDIITPEGENGKDK